jgi:hypothetical protein
MLSFDVSVIDIILAVAIVVLLCLYIAKKPDASTIESKSKVDEVHPLRENKKLMLKASRLKNSAKSPTSFQNCVHIFGYLRNMPRNTPVPDECFGCPKVMQCLFPNE